MFINNSSCVTLSLSYHSSSLEDNGCRLYHSELEEKTADAVAIFSDNLHHSDKEIRISTLKILCYYKPLVWENSSVDQPADMKRKTEVSPTSNADCTENNVHTFKITLHFF